MSVESVCWDWISLIDLNHCRIVTIMKWCDLQKIMSKFAPGFIYRFIKLVCSDLNLKYDTAIGTAKQTAAMLKRLM